MCSQLAAMLNTQDTLIKVFVVVVVVVDVKKKNQKNLDALAG